MKTMLTFCFTLISFIVFSAAEVPQKIISLGPTCTKQLFLLGVGNRIVGNTIYCETPEAAKKITKVGNVININVEKIMELKPDIIFASELTDEGQLKKLRNLGITNIIKLSSPINYDEICKQLLKIGNLTGTEKLAESIVENSEKKVAEIRKNTSLLPKTKVFIQIGSDPLFAVTKDSFINNIIIFAGGVNIAENDRNGVYSLEKVIEKNPDVIIVSLMGNQTGREIKHWNKFTVVPAVKNNRIYSVDAYELCSPSAKTFPDILKKIAIMLHPELEK